VFEQAMRYLVADVAGLPMRVVGIVMHDQACSAVEDRQGGKALRVNDPEKSHKTRTIPRSGNCREGNERNPKVICQGVRVQRVRHGEPKLGADLGGDSLGLRLEPVTQHR
jgi:hypothetical protein